MQILGHTPDLGDQKLWVRNLEICILIGVGVLLLLLLFLAILRFKKCYTWKDQENQVQIQATLVCKPRQATSVF